MNLKENLLLAIRASIDAGKAILKVYDNANFETEFKKDNSPLTLADLNSNKVIMSYLKATDIPIISEENKTVDFEERKNWELFWMVDPLDGTKEFIKRNGEFTVNIALIQKGTPLLGVVYVPVSRELYIGNVKENRSYKVILDKEGNLPRDLFGPKYKLNPQSHLNTPTCRVVGSRSHMNMETENFINDLKESGKKVEIVSKGSSLKFCMVAEGNADIYPRVAPTMEWDTAAGHAICKALGLSVTQWETDKELQYNKEDLLNPFFLVH